MRNPIKIAYIIGQLSKGGAEGQLYELLKHLDRDKFQPFVCSLSDGGYWAGPIRELGIEVVELKWNRHYDLGRLFKLYKILVQWKPDIVQTILISANSYGRITARLAGISRIIASERVLDRNQTSFQIWIDRVLDIITDRYIVNSSAILDFLSNGNHRLDRDKIVIIHNGVDIERYNVSKDQKNKEQMFGIKDSDKVVGMVGRLTPQKNYNCFLDAAKIVCERFPSIKFLIVGDGELKEYLKDYAMRLGISGKVIFTGVRNDLPEVYSIMDIFVLSSDYEGLPNVVLEAMASSKPVVATNIEGTSDAVVDNKTGILVPPGQPEKLAEAILKILHKEDLAKSMGKDARRRVEKEFSLQGMVNRTEGLYLSLFNTC